jgi:hypothetical protein
MCFLHKRGTAFQCRGDLHVLLRCLVGGYTHPRPLQRIRCPSPIASPPTWLWFSNSRITWQYSSGVKAVVKAVVVDWSGLRVCTCYARSSYGVWAYDRYGLPGSDISFQCSVGDSLLSISVVVVTLPCILCWAFCPSSSCMLQLLPLSLSLAGPSVTWECSAR